MGQSQHLAAATATVDPAYLALIGRFPLRPLRTEDEYRQAATLMNELLDSERSASQDDYLAVLSDLVGDYEDAHHEMPAPTPGGILRALLDDRGVSQTELSQATGIAESNISAMLKGTRGIGKNARAAFAAFFEVKPTRFVVE